MARPTAERGVSTAAKPIEKSLAKGPTFSLRNARERNTRRGEYVISNDSIPGTKESRCQSELLNEAECVVRMSPAKEP